MLVVCISLTTETGDCCVLHWEAHVLFFMLNKTVYLENVGKAILSKASSSTWKRLSVQ